MAKAKSTVASPYPEEDKKWMAENDLRTLIEAEKIKADADRMKAAMKMRDEQKKALNNIKD